MELTKGNSHSFLRSYLLKKGERLITKATQSQLNSGCLFQKVHPVRITQQDMTKLDIQKRLEVSLRSKDTRGASVYRAVIAAIQTLEQTKGRNQSPASESEVIGIVRKQISQRIESIDAFTKAGRTESAAKEKVEQSILEGLLPTQMDREELRVIVLSEAKRLQADSKKMLGQVIAAVKERVGTNADPRMIAQLATEIVTQ